MIKYEGKLKNILYLIRRWRDQIIDVSKLVIGFPRLMEYLKDWKKYSKMEGAEPIKLINTYPCLHEKTKITNIDYYYFYQDIWAFKRIFESDYKHHVDIGSDIDFVGYITAIKKVTFLDIRPLRAKVENLESKRGNILSLPFKNNSIHSLSCLHVAEHIGLGRFGDSIDPLGTKKAAKELSRVLAKNGNLYFALPIGKPRLCFNAHRIHSTEQIFNYFSELELIELSGINDEGLFLRNVERDFLDSCNYGCGLFWFTKK